MNGVHDMGGMHGMGPIKPEPNEPVFHEPWEGRVYGLSALSRWGRGRNWGSFRFELESIPAADYLKMSYYERWFTVRLNRLLRSQLVTEAELANGHANPLLPQPTLLAVTEPGTAAATANNPNEDIAPRYNMNQRVRAKNMHPKGHTRLPRYTRGKAGHVHLIHGIFALQDTDVNGQRLGNRPQHVYTIRFTARELWGARASAHDAIYVDLWEDYLEPA